ncbi:MAG: glycosyltransferase [Dehalococcoidia bacterium]|nr:glycosyltransferase [Dehalococcoidia bacterium]
MKILMVSKACYLAAYRKKLEEMAALPGVDLTLIVPPYWQMGKKRAVLEQGPAGGYQMIVDNPLLNGHFHLHFYPRLAGLLSRIRPDILHIDEEPYDLVTFHATRLALRHGAKVVFFTWQNLWKKFPLPFGLMERHVLRRAHGAIAGSVSAAEILQRKGFRGPLAIIPQFGVDPEVFRPMPVAKAPRPFTIGFAGRLVREKGLHLMLEAAAGLEGDWRILVVGEGPLRQQLEAAAARLGVRAKVEFVGGTPSAEMPSRYREMDVLVLPSFTVPHWKEQFGRVIIEAMACGLPVVGSDSGEIPHVMGEAGLVFPEGDVPALRSALACLMESPDLRSELGRMGRQRVLAHYTQKRIAEETYAFYERVLGCNVVRAT